jgi:hypothetical protein
MGSDLSTATVSPEEYRDASGTARLLGQSNCDALARYDARWRHKMC